MPSTNSTSQPLSLQTTIVWISLNCMTAQLQGQFCPSHRAEPTASIRPPIKFPTASASAAPRRRHSSSEYPLGSARESHHSRGKVVPLWRTPPPPRRSNRGRQSGRGERPTVSPGRKTLVMRLSWASFLLCAFARCGLSSLGLGCSTGWWLCC
jgi:hypothetical protein